METAHQSPGSKTLILVRHAKSSWDSPSLSDFDRPLNDRGKKDAPEMARRLKDRKIGIDVFVSSSAKRAKKTAKIFAAAFDVDKDDIVLVDALYLATPDAFASTVATLDNKRSTAILFSHNPGITDYANAVSPVRIDDMPTCAIIAVKAKTESWHTFEEAEKEFLFFDYPKNDLD